MNPGTVNREQLRAFRELGVNRASFGAQTFDDAELASMIDLARRGIAELAALQKAALDAK